MEVKKETPEVNAQETPSAEAQLSELKEKFDKAEQRAKSYEGQLRTTQSENKRLAALHEEIGDIKADLGMVMETIGQRRQPVADEEEDVESKGKQTNTLTQQREQREQGRLTNLARKIDSSAKGAGLDMSTSSELLKAQNLWLQGDYRGAEAEVERVVASVTDAKQEEKKVEKPQETEAEMRERIKREILIERGELAPEGQVPAASSAGINQMLNMSDEDFAKNRDRLYEQMSEGRLK